MTPTDNQRYAVAKLVGYCEGMIRSGALPEPFESRMREAVVATCNEFGMPSDFEMCGVVDGALNPEGVA